MILKIESKVFGFNLGIMFYYEISCIIIFKDENVREMENILIVF